MDHTVQALDVRMHATATALGVALDGDLSAVYIADDGVVNVVATVDSTPSTEEERSLSQSALHIALLDDLADVTAGVDVRVFVPPSVGGGPQCDTAKPVLASQTIRGWNKGVQELAAATAVQLAISSYTCAVDTYPWIHREEMRARIPAAVTQTVEHMTGGTPDTFLTGRCVDLILPPLEAVVRANESDAVVGDVTRVLGGLPNSILQFYEVIYLCVTNRVRVSDETRAVFGRLFCM